MRWSCWGNPTLSPTRGEVSRFRLLVTPQHDLSNVCATDKSRSKSMIRVMALNDVCGLIRPKVGEALALCEIALEHSTPYSFSNINSPAECEWLVLTETKIVNFYLLRTSLENRATRRVLALCENTTTLPCKATHNRGIFTVTSTYTVSTIYL
jgi:hypothetical protein